MVDTMSEKSVEVVAGLVTKRGVNGRRTYSAPAKRALAELCNGPGVSVAAMALQHGINANLLRRWITQYSAAKLSAGRPAASGKSAATLLAVTTPMPSATRPSISADPYIEITFAAATIRVHGAVDARVLGVVLDCLAQRA
jgi:transposase-like protein